jgi:hypothetical protein
LSALRAGRTKLNFTSSHKKKIPQDFYYGMWIVLFFLTFRMITILTIISFKVSQKVSETNIIEPTIRRKDKRTQCSR